MTSQRLEQLTEEHVTVVRDMDATKAKIADAEREQAAILTTADLDDAAHAARLSQLQLILSAGPTRVAALEAKRTALEGQISDECIALGEAGGTQLSKIKAARINTFR